MDLVARNIVVLFDEQISRNLIALSQHIDAVVPSDIVLNMATMIPHATLYTTNYPAKNEEKVIQRLREVTSHMQAFPVSFTTLVVDMLGVWINAEKTPRVQKVHEQIVDALNPLREGLYDEKELFAIGEDKKREESLYKYGMWAAKELYIPHVTLSRPTNSTRLQEALQLVPSSSAFETVITEIAFVERGPFGTCRKILQTFPLLA